MFGSWLVAAAKADRSLSIKYWTLKFKHRQFGYKTSASVCNTSLLAKPANGHVVISVVRWLAGSIYLMCYIVILNLMVSSYENLNYLDSSFLWWYIKVLALRCLYQNCNYPVTHIYMTQNFTNLLALPVSLPHLSVLVALWVLWLGSRTCFGHQQSRPWQH